MMDALETTLDGKGSLCNCRARAKALCPLAMLASSQGSLRNSPHRQTATGQRTKYRDSFPLPFVCAQGRGQDDDRVQQR
jgi:hypothetical protein